MKHRIEKALEIVEDLFKTLEKLFIMLLAGCILNVENMYTSLLQDMQKWILKYKKEISNLPRTFYYIGWWVKSFHATVSASKLNQTNLMVNLYNEHISPSTQHILVTPVAKSITGNTDHITVMHTHGSGIRLVCGLRDTWT